MNAGVVTAGQPLAFAMRTSWLDRTYWAFAGNDDDASRIAFGDVTNLLRRNGLVAVPAGPSTWVLHLNDAAHYTLAPEMADNLLMQVRIAAPGLQPIGRPAPR